MARLGLDYLDLYLIHWPSPAQDKYLDTWRGFEALLAQGRVRSIGVSNFLPEHLDRLLGAADIVPAVNQIELHPCCNNAKPGPSTKGTASRPRPGVRWPGAKPCRIRRYSHWPLNSAPIQPN